MFRNPLKIAILALWMPVAAAATEPAPLGYGLSVTSNNIDRGETQSDDDPAVQGHLEGRMGPVYAGVRASSVKRGADRLEAKVFLGVRPKVGALSLDLNYQRYLYARSGDCCGEVALTVARPVGERGSFGARVALDPEAERLRAEATASLVVARDVAVGGAVGRDSGVAGEPGGDRVSWRLGASRAFADTVTVDVQRHDSNVDPARTVLSIAFEF